MSDDEMIAAMVKGRELCRQLVCTYESAHARGDEDGGQLVGDIDGLANADRTASRMLACLHELPGRPTELLADDARRPYVSRLLSEIAALLDRLMILEREVRSRVSDRKSDSAAVMPGRRALRAYGGY